MGRYLGIAKETTFGEFTSPTKYIPIMSEDISESREELLEEPIGYFDPTDARPGYTEFAGGIEYKLRLSTIGAFFEGLLGQVSTSVEATTSGKTLYKHEFTPVQPGDLSGNQLPSFSLEVGMDDIGARRYSGVVFKGMSLEIVPNDWVGMSTDIIARKMTITSSQSSPSISYDKPLVWFDGKVTIKGGVTTEIKALTLEISNDIITGEDALRIIQGTTGMYPVEFVLRGREVTVEMDVAVEDLDWLGYFMGGSASATELSEYFGTMSAQIVLRGQYISDLSTYERIVIDIPKLIISESAINVDGRERLIQNLSCRAIYDSDAGYAIKVTVYSTVSSYT